MQPGPGMHDFLDIPPPEEGIVAEVGEPLAEGVRVATEDEIILALKEVYDPEIPVDIYELGLIYEIDIKDNGDVKILMTLTAPACPVAGQLPIDVGEKAASVKGVGRVQVELSWEPAWTPERMSDEARLALNMF
ncbi:MULTISPECIES: SUF system Fe-S cluster assembly protein [Nisaea]|uniref:SUF system Fe-S cluster assembly protein n=1 Tax=Nisaea TaxID=390876 RepID=UPI000402EF2F|nr:MULTISPECIES: SUF system Fe-S cluster assembly protein [Nisaea]